MSYETLEYKIDGLVGILTLNRPDNYNAITSQMNDELLDVLGKIQIDKNIRAVMLTGNGKGFSAGADLATFGDPSSVSPYEIENNLNLKYSNIVRRLMNLNKPVIGAINGSVAGAAIGFALSCDFLFMADTASMRYAFINIALVPDAGSSWFLVQAVGYHKAMQIIAGGEKIPAQDCLNMGLVHSIYPVDSLKEEALAFAHKIANGPTAAYVSTKKILRYGVTHTLNEAMEMEASEQAKNILGADNIEGVTAFLQKRQPEFKGEGYKH